jgi:acyl-CoA thioesterase-1
MNFNHIKSSVAEKAFFAKLVIKVAFVILVSQPAFSQDNHTVLILGDSISAGYGINPHKGWVTLLDEKISSQITSQATVINASVSGNTSGDGLARLPKLIETHTPDIIVVELGGNDGLRGFPLKIMESNLNSIISLGKKADADVILAGIEIPPNYGPRYTSEFKKVFVRVAQSHEITFIPFILDGIALEPELMQDDGIHPTEQAQPRLLENIWPSIANFLTVN